MRAPIRVFVVDDHELIRRGLRDLIGGVPDLIFAGESSSAAEARARLVDAAPDVAVVDLRLPDGDGVMLCRDIRSTSPQTRCLIFTSFADDDARLEAVLAGAVGYVLKGVAGDVLLEAIRTAARGKSLFEGEGVAALLDRLRGAGREPDPRVTLTAQEERVLAEIARGLTNRDIGHALNLTEKTVKNYVSRILSKLGIESRTQAAILALGPREARTGSDGKGGSPDSGPRPPQND